MPQPASPEPPTIPVSQPVQREVTDYSDFTGRSGAIDSVDLRARVTGYLVKMPFMEGADVKTGDLLFEVDPRPYQAQLNQALGQVNLYKAQLTLATTNLARGKGLLGSNAISPSDYDALVAAEAEADAQVKAAEANVEVFKLNVAFTKVTSPVDGQVGRYFLTVGNLVTQDQTLLTTIQSLDPMYVYFDVDERTVVRVRKAINEGRIKPHANGRFPVLMGLEGEDGFPREGSINFVNNQVNPNTGSILLRGVFPNPLPPGGRRLLLPGMFVRVRLPIGLPHPALLVIDRAIGSDQTLKYVYVVDSEDKVQYRRVTTGPAESDGLRVISEGLKPGDWVVVGGLQQVRPRMQVRLERMAMPSLTQAAEGETPPAEPAKSTPAENPPSTPTTTGKPSSTPPTGKSEG